MFGRAWGGSWADSWGKSWGEDAPGAGGSSWGCTWGQTWGDTWGDTTTCAVTPTPPPTDVLLPDGGFRTGPGRRKKLSKKKRTLLDELEELRSAIQAMAIEPMPAVEAAIDRSAYLLELEDFSRVSAQQIATHVARMRRILEELEDEEIILLALH